MGIAFKQCWTLCGIILNLITIGYHLGYPTILLRDLKAPGSDIRLSLEAESWVVSSVAITALLSGLLVAPTLEILGRKSAHICIVIPNLVASLILYFAKDITALVIARLASGFTFGTTIFVAAIIIGEYSSPENRGVFLNAKSASYTIGVFLVHCVGIFCDWRRTALIGLVPSVLSLINTLTWSESPAWLAYKGKYEACEASFQELRGNSYKAKEELLLLIQTQRNRRLSRIKSKSKISSLRQNLSKFGRKDFVKPSLIALSVFVILESSGRHSFSAYAVKFMSAFTTTNAKTLYYVLAVDGVVCICGILSCFIVKLFRRRTILFTSGVLACILLLSICVYLYLKAKGIAPEDNIWLPLALLFTYHFVVSFGVAPIIMSLLGEVYPLEHKGLGTVVSGVLFSLSVLVALKVTPALIKNIEVYGTFLVYSLFLAGAFVYLYIFLPETEGKTLQEIEHNFNGVSLTLQNETEDKPFNCK
ncbi:facilitated trehalose transporter Tret1-like isoform X1 [Leguminivora glycinivorella]|uniref:facilitated trehalose transporter Tret1-like isoform X1 n=1 Tax=Leguminivora glycinivorella TaxID=1035111 RepID=UPI00200DF154|nr:facilitated trehalose transporter Tret1-like isoform X1 [Leguminivora glycinivorella]